MNAKHNTICILDKQDNTFCQFAADSTICIVAAMNWKDLIKQRLELLGMTQAELAEKLDKTQGGVGHWLNGRREPPFAALQEIADILKIDRAALGATVMEARGAAHMARNSFEKAVLDAVRDVPEEKRERFIGWLEAKMEELLPKSTAGPEAKTHGSGVMKNRKV